MYMLEKAYKVFLWLGAFFGALYLPTRLSVLGGIGAVLIFLAGVMRLSHDYKHQQLPWQQKKKKESGTVIIRRTK